MIQLNDPVVIIAAALAAGVLGTALYRRLGAINFLCLLVVLLVGALSGRVAIKGPSAAPWLPERVLAAPHLQPAAWVLVMVAALGTFNFLRMALTPKSAEARAMEAWLNQQTRSR